MLQKKSSLSQIQKIKKNIPDKKLISCRNLNEIIVSLFLTKSMKDK